MGHVTRTRRGLPPALAVVHHVAMGPPALTPFVPVYWVSLRGGLLWLLLSLLRCVYGVCACARERVCTRGCGCGGGSGDGRGARCPARPRNVWDASQGFATRDASQGLG